MSQVLSLAQPQPAVVPRHVAVVMDGNGRWARQRYMPRFFGHKAGVDALVRAVNLFADAKDGVRIRIVGDRDAVSDKLREAWEQAEDLTRDNRRITLAVAFNYGGRWDVVQACRQALAEGIAPDRFDEQYLSQHMALSFAPDPDLFIRTGGEMRMSNFLLWQAAYSELFFTDCLWPDFGASEIDAALAAYAARDRRFGGIRPPVVAEGG